MTEASTEVCEQGAPARGKARSAWSPAGKRNHLRALEAESIYILREAVAEFSRPVMLYSIGKDSSVMLRLSQKAFYPAKFRFRCCMWTRATSFRK